MPLWLETFITYMFVFLRNSVVRWQFCWQCEAKVHIFKSQNVVQFLKVSILVLISIVFRKLTHTGEPFHYLYETEHDCGIDNGIVFFLLIGKLCEFRPRCEVQQVSHALSQSRLLFVSEWRTGIPRYEWTHSTPGNFTNYRVVSWSQLLSQDITSTAYSDSWLPAGVGFDKAWFSCLAPAGPHLETCLLSPQSDS